VREEAVIRARFEIYMAVRMRKVEAMRPAAAIVGEILAALSPANPALSRSRTFHSPKRRR
jgi:shikimate kinase